MARGRKNPSDHHEPLNMAVLALRTTAHANAVSELQGEVPPRLFRTYLADIPEHEVPVAHVTNGVHTRTWVSREMAQLFDRYLGPEWTQRPGQPSTWKSVDDIPDEESRSTPERRRKRMANFAG